MNIEARAVSKSFGSVTAVRDASFTLGGGIVGLLGPNGAGKTTMLRMLATLLPPSKGGFLMGQWDVQNSRDRVEIRRRLGYLPQEVGFYPNFTVFQFVDYMAALKELRDRGTRHEAVRGALDAVDLTELASRKIKTLSGGMKRRLGVAQALVGDPEILLLDEPTTGLDPQQRAQFRQLLAGLGERRMVLLSSHLVEDIAAVCGQVLVLLQGSIAFNGTPSELRSLATGRVWSSRDPVADAVMSWRTEDGWYRVLGSEPVGHSKPIQPTLEDGYLLLAGQTKNLVA